jgi:hypothetical protein
LHFAQPGQHHGPQPAVVFGQGGLPVDGGQLVAPSRSRRPGGTSIGE